MKTSVPMYVCGGIKKLRLCFLGKADCSLFYRSPHTSYNDVHVLMHMCVCVCSVKLMLAVS